MWLVCFYFIPLFFRFFIRIFSYFSFIMFFLFLFIIIFSYFYSLSFLIFFYHLFSLSLIFFYFFIFSYYFLLFFIHDFFLFLFILKCSCFKVKKVLEKRPKERQSMVFQRPRGTRSAVAQHTVAAPAAAAPFHQQASNPGTPSVSQHRRQSSQNVYTELPTKTDNHVRQKSADSSDGRLVNPNRCQLALT